MLIGVFENVQTDESSYFMIAVGVEWRARIPSKVIEFFRVDDSFLM